MKYPADLVGIKRDGAEVLSRDSVTKLYTVRCGCGAKFTRDRARITTVLKGKQLLRCSACWKKASRQLLLGMGNQFKQKGETAAPKTWAALNSELKAVTAERDELKAQIADLKATLNEIQSKQHPCPALAPEQYAEDTD